MRIDPIFIKTMTKGVAITKSPIKPNNWVVRWGFKVPVGRWSGGIQAFSNHGQALTFAKKLHKEMGK
jgi:hypothetical protein